MNTANSFIKFGNYRIDSKEIKSYKIVNGTETIVMPRSVKIDPNSIEGEARLQAHNRKTTKRAIGAGVASATAGTIGGGIVGVATSIATLSNPVGWITFGAIAVGSTVLGVSSSLKKSQKRKVDLYRKDGKRVQDASVLEVELKSFVTSESISGYAGITGTNSVPTQTNLLKVGKKQYDTLCFHVGKCGFDIYDKCRELDAFFGISGEN